MQVLKNAQPARGQQLEIVHLMNPNWEISHCAPFNQQHLTPYQ